MKEGKIRYLRLKDVESPFDCRVEPLVGGIINCVHSALGRDDYSRDEIKARIHGALMILGLDGERVVSYSSMEFGRMGELLGDDRFGDEQGCYFVAGMVAGDSQGNGFYSELNAVRVGEALDRGADMIFTRTQNPVVELGLVAAMKKCGVDFSVERYYLPAVYGEMLTASKPVVGDPEVQSEYDRLDYEAGDAYVLVFRLEDK